MALFDYNNRNIKNLAFKDLFESSRTLKTDEDIDFTLNGLMRVISKKRNRQMVDSLRNLFNLFPDIVQDLYTSNIQRGRDQGIPDYNSIRRHLGLG
jgi:peroxidase